MTRSLTILFCLVVFTLPASAQRVKIRFAPESDKFASATKEYQDLWMKEGDKMIRALEKVTKLKFTEAGFDAIVYEGVSWSGYKKQSPMKMRASYPADTKKATLIHEIGHRHVTDLRLNDPALDEHRVLFLFLYDVWVKLYGKAFADAQVEVEKKRRGVYPAAWDWALTMTKKERAEKFKAILNENKKLK